MFTRYRVWNTGTEEMIHLDQYNDLTSFFFNDSYIIMRDWNIKDIRDNRIFTGDIIELHYMVDLGEGNIGEKSEILAIDCFFNMYDLLFDKSVLSVEVLGNIFQNPEIIEKDDDITFSEFDEKNHTMLLKRHSEVKGSRFKGWNI